MKHLILGYSRAKNKWQCLERALKKNGHEVDVVTENFDDIVGPYDRIYTVSESLLPLHAKLEKLWGLNNISEKAADILSDKSKMDNWCINLGLRSIIPHSVIPTKHTDLDVFEDTPFIIKPIIGSGAKPGGLNYISFRNKKEFLLHAGSSFFDDNKKGKLDGEFNNRKNYYMAQEQLPDHSVMWGPYGYVNDKGEFKILMWVRGEILYNKIDEYSYETKNGSWMSFDEKEVPTDIKENAYNFFNKLVSSLKLKNMFFSGPDFYKWEDTIKYIDCNPRLGQGLQQMDDVHKSKIVAKILNDEPISFDRQIYWAVSNLKPGKIKSMKNINHLKGYWCKTNNDRLRPGETIPKFAHITTEKAPRVSFLITGVNESDMKKTYQTVNTELQNCIEYY